MAGEVACFKLLNADLVTKSSVISIGYYWTTSIAISADGTNKPSFFAVLVSTQVARKRRSVRDAKIL